MRSRAATFDVVTARTETYAAPGALPDVRPGATIEQDLARRDFTVNAIALRVADGALTEWPGAQEDLRAGVLRVLHERSFEDDPTRLLRMARYAARLGFEPDPATDALAAAATVRDGLGRPAGLRAAAAAARAPARGRCWRSSATGSAARSCIRPSAPTPALIERALAAVPARGARRPRRARRRAGGTRGRCARRSTGSSSTRPRGRSSRRPRRCGWRDGLGDAGLWLALRDAPPEAVAVAGALGPAEAARRWLDDVRHRRLAITGDDFVAAGLDRARRSATRWRPRSSPLLAGEAPGAAEQLAAGLAAVRPS